MRCLACQAASGSPPGPPIPGISVVCAHSPMASIGRWLGSEGPVLDFLRGCRVHGNAGLLNPTNAAATAQAPIGYRKLGSDKALYIGLHLETDDPEALIALCQASATPLEDCGGVWGIKRYFRHGKILTIRTIRDLLKLWAVRLILNALTFRK